MPSLGYHVQSVSWEIPQYNFLSSSHAGVGMSPTIPYCRCIANFRNTMANTPRIQGPASYFPSIEKKYGHPVARWFTILQQAGERKHMELVNLLKSEHQLGHGHANALVAHHLSQQTKPGK